MGSEELPETKAARVDWVIRADSNEEMRRRYDIWAEHYDDDVGSYEDYLVPREAALVARGKLETEARIFDAGAGTGLVGQALAEHGFTNLVAVDYAAQMLEVARTKGVYEEFHVCDLGKATDFPADSFDAVITCGTTSQMPCYSLREFVRVLRPGGIILFAAVPDAWIEFGYAAIFDELVAARRIRLLNRGTRFQMMPTTEPDFFCEILTIEVLQARAE